VPDVAHCLFWSLASPYFSGGEWMSAVSEDRRLRILAEEHLPDGVASQVEFLAFFRHLLRASADDFESTGMEVRVVCWLVASTVRHYVVVRDRGTGQMCCRLEIGVAMRVAPPDLDHHANQVSGLLTAALNLDRSADSSRESPDDDA
jgi:hypothetical protein